jgi:hypothetical protein
MPRRLKVEFARLFGFSDSDARTIWIDPRQTDKQLLGTIVHEAAHQVFPQATEAQVQELETLATSLLWDRFKFRRLRQRGK